MALLQLKDVSYSYSEEQYILQHIDLSIDEGAFVTIFGPSGSGKSTLLKLMKPTSLLNGNVVGEILYEGKTFSNLNEKQKVSDIGFVYQNPDHQIVVEDVWHELAFGLENLGLSTVEMKVRIGEMANFFGIQHWFRKKVSNLSGGQKQLLNMASVLVLHPKLLILDEPTAQLDPIAAKELMNMLGRINQELGVTIVIVEHRLEELLSYTTQFVFMKKGQILIQGSSESFFHHFAKKVPAWQCYLPAVVQLSLTLDPEKKPALTIQQGLARLKNKSFMLRPPVIKHILQENIILELKNLSFRYHRYQDDILRDVQLNVYEGEIISLLGGNGAGKSTLLQTITGQLKPYKGKIYLHHERIRFNKKMYQQEIGLLPQDPQLLFLESTIEKDFERFGKRHGLTKEECKKRIIQCSKRLNIAHLLQHHPEDLSGGELQKVALAKLLLYQPHLLLLDEPTKGLDPQAKQEIIFLLRELQREGLTIVIVTHDIDFAAVVSDRCGLFFDGHIPAVEEPHCFFMNNHFYTTAANQLAKPVEPRIILTSELLEGIQQKEIHDGHTTIIR